MNAPSHPPADRRGEPASQSEQQALQTEITALKEAGQVQLDLLAFVSHEIKAPIGAMKAMAELLYGTKLTDPQTHYVNTLCFALENLMRNADDMLQMAQVKREQFSYDLRAVNFPTLLQALALPLAKQAGAKGLKFSAEMAKNVPTNLMIDPNRFSQVINNLCGNAIKYTDQGSISLAVSAIEQSAEESEITITISDTGRGISKAEQEKIFAPFMQGKNAKEGGQPGSGLGLWISKEIAAGMNGAVSCQSEENRGSIFTFAFRAKHGESQEHSSKHPAEAINAAESPVLGPSEKEEQTEPGLSLETGQAIPPLRGHVLIVEDNQINQMLIQIYLDKFGLTFECVENGNQALARLEQQTYDVVLMDILMPELDGLTTAKLLHERWQESDRIPIIALSASASAISSEDYHAVGIADSVVKPICGEKFYHVLAKYLAKRNLVIQASQNEHSAETELVTTSKSLNS